MNSGGRLAIHARNRSIRGSALIASAAEAPRNTAAEVLFGGFALPIETLHETDLTASLPVAPVDRAPDPVEDPDIAVLATLCAA